MSVRRALAAALLVPLALLSACTEDEPVPQMPDPTTVTPSPTDASSTAAPETPEEFIRRWHAVVDDAQTTGDTADFEAMSQDCGPCSDFVKLVSNTYDNGGKIESGGSQVKSVRSVGADGETYDSAVTTAESWLTPEAGGKRERYPGGDQVFRIQLVQSGTSFKITDYRVLAQ